MPPPKRARITSPTRRPHRATRPDTPAAKADKALASAGAPIRRHVSRKTRDFIRVLATNPQMDPTDAAKSVGFSEPSRGMQIAAKYRDLLESETLRASMSRQMELDEALIRLADLARQSTDDRVKHGSLRTVLEVHGALSNTKIPAGERGGVMRQIEELVGAIKGKLKGDNPDRVSRNSPTRRRTRVAIEIQEEPNHEDSPTTAISVTPIRDQEDPH